MDKTTRIIKSDYFMAGFIVGMIFAGVVLTYQSTKDNEMWLEAIDQDNYKIKKMLREQKKKHPVDVMEEKLYS